MIADDRRRSQKIEHGSIFCDRLRSSAITIAGSQAIAEVCFHMIADDRRTFCDLRSARSSAIIWKPALTVSDAIDDTNDRGAFANYFFLLGCEPNSSERRVFL